MREFDWFEAHSKCVCFFFFHSDFGSKREIKETHGDNNFFFYRAIIGIICLLLSSSFGWLVSISKFIHRIWNTHYARVYDFASYAHWTIAYTNLFVVTIYAQTYHLWLDFFDFFFDFFYCKCYLFFLFNLNLNLSWKIMNSWINSERLVFLLLYVLLFCLNWNLSMVYEMGKYWCR